MKKWIALILAFVLVLSLAACGSGSEKPVETTQAPSDKAEQAAVSADQPTEVQPAAPEDDPAAGAELIFVVADTAYGQDDIEYLYTVYTSYVPESLEGAKESDADEAWFKSEYEYDSDNLYYGTQMRCSVRSQISEEKMLDDLHSSIDTDSQKGYEAGDVSTVKGTGYTAYYVIDSRSSSNEWDVHETYCYAWVCFDDEFISMNVELSVFAEVNLDPEAEGEDANSDFQPDQYAKDVQDQFLRFLNSLSFVREEVQE